MSNIAEFTKATNPNVREMTGGYTLSNLQTLLKVADDNGFGIPA